MSDTPSSQVRSKNRKLLRNQIGLGNKQ